MALRLVKDENVIIRVTNSIRSFSVGTYESYVGVAYLMLKVLENDYNSHSFEEFLLKSDISEDRKLFLSEQTVLSNRWDEFTNISKSFNREALVTTIIFFAEQDYLRYGGMNSTPDCICRLVSRILDIKDGEKVADLCCGIGSFLTQVANEIDAKIFGLELNPNSWIVCQIKLELLSDKAEIVLRNAFNTDINAIKADKAFSNYPWSIKPEMMGIHMDDVTMINDIPAFKKHVSSDWLFNLALINSITDDGIAVGIMTNGRTFDAKEREIREYFVKSGYIKAVISLPENLFPYTSIPSTMIVMGHGNKEVMMVNAVELFEHGRRKNIISDDDITRIVNACVEETDISMRMTIEEIETKDYCINPARYFAEEIAMECGTQFGEIVKSIRRGAQIKAAELDGNASTEETPYQYLMLSNISNGLIDDNLPYLASLDTKLEKYCLKQGDLIISKIGTPTKIAVAEVDNDKKVLANGNLYIVEIDTEKANPYYIKAFLESPQGQYLIEREQVGTFMKSISLESLKGIQIPLIPIERQNELGNLYQSKIDSLRLQKIRYERTLKEMSNIYEIWKEGV